MGEENDASWDGAGESGGLPSGWGLNRSAGAILLEGARGALTALAGGETPGAKAIERVSLLEEDVGGPLGLGDAGSERDRWGWGGGESPRIDSAESWKVELGAGSGKSEGENGGVWGE
jgi:hypothetical protein